MPSPFPGMDPYLEHPLLWPGLHRRLIVALADDLTPKVRPRYFVEVEERIYQSAVDGLVLIGRSDVHVVSTPAPKPAEVSPAATVVAPRTVRVPVPDEIRETFLEVRSVEEGEVITVVELLSPTNKRPGEGRRTYEMKRQRILGSLTHLLEIDLLRAGQRLPVEPDTGKESYRILASRANRRPNAELFCFGVRDQIPPFAMPLRPGDPEPIVDLGAVLNSVYDRGGYDLRVQYGRNPTPPLEDDDARWADTHLREQGLR